MKLIRGQGVRFVLGAAALATIVGLTPGMALARGGGGAGGGSGASGMGPSGSGMEDRDQQRDQSRDQMRDQARDQDRLQDRIRDMDRIRDRLHQGVGGSQRQQLMSQYRQNLNQAMQQMGRGNGPGPNASTEERLRYMQERNAQMREMMQHMWDYENMRGPQQ